jgi:DNA-binding LytR/AlgR family response regulator
MIGLIVEDEPVAARQLARMLADAAPELALEDPLSSVESALHRLCRGPRPAVIFLDVQLSDGQGFDLVRAFPSDIPVIITTAFDMFALTAFDLAAVDYLLKPIAPERLTIAVERWRRVGHLSGAVTTPAPATKRRFLVEAKGELVSIPVDRIAYFYRDLVVRLVTTDGEQFSIDRTIDQIEAVLDGELFFRLNRQVLASASSIARVYRLFKSKLGVELAPRLTREIVVSAERAARFREWLGG